MSVLITGARGFIGRHLTAALDEQGIAWRAFKGDVTRPEDFSPYHACGSLIHLAGVSRTDRSCSHIQRLLKVNINGTANALAFAAEKGMRFFFAGTCCYKKTPAPPNKESDPITYLDEYSYSKWASENLISRYSEFLGLTAVIFRIFNVYGPGQREGYVIPDMIRKALRGGFEVQNGGVVRDFIHIRDLTRLMILALTNPSPGLNVLNAGSGVGATISELAGIIAGFAGGDARAGSHGGPVLIENSQADITKAKALLSWEPEVTLQSGLAEIINDWRGRAC